MGLPVLRAKKINSDDYVEGIGVDENFLIERICLSRNEDKKIRKQEDGDYEYKAIYHHIDSTTLAIQIGKRKLFMSLDVKTGKGGDKISDNEVLVWNDEMMNCSILEIDELVGLHEYEINLDNLDFDKMIVIGIQQ